MQDTSSKLKGQKFNLGSLLTWFEFSLSPVHLPDIESIWSQIPFLTRVFLLLDAADLQQHCPHLPEQSYGRAAHPKVLLPDKSLSSFQPQTGWNRSRKPTSASLCANYEPCGYSSKWSIIGVNVPSVCCTRTQQESRSVGQGFPACWGSLVNLTAGWLQQG